MRKKTTKEEYSRETETKKQKFWLCAFPDRLAAAFWLQHRDWRRFIVICRFRAAMSWFSYWWHFPARRVAWVVSSQGERALWCLKQQFFSKLKEMKRIFGRNKFLCCSDNFHVIINFTGKHLQLQLPPSHRHQFHIKTAAGATRKKRCPQTQMMLNDYADYDLGAASFVSNCALLCGRGPCVV